MTSNQNSGSMNYTTITSVQISFPEIRLATR